MFRLPCSNQIQKYTNTQQNALKYSMMYFIHNIVNIRCLLFKSEPIHFLLVITQRIDLATVRSRNDDHCILVWHKRPFDTFDQWVTYYFFYIDDIYSDLYYIYIYTHTHTHTSAALRQVLKNYVALLWVDGGQPWYWLCPLRFNALSYLSSGLPRNFFGGVNKFSWRQRERGSGGGSPLIRGSGGSCNLVQEISFHIVKFSQFLVL